MNPGLLSDELEHDGNVMYGSTESDPVPRAYLIDAEGAAEYVEHEFTGLSDRYDTATKRYQ